MKNNPIKIGALCLALGLFSSSGSLFADNKHSDYKKSVEQISREIKSMTKQLNKSKALLKTERDRMMALEKEMLALRNNKSITQNKISDYHQQVKQLEQEIKKLQENQQQDLQDMAKLMLNRYVNGQPNYLKMVLNQQNPYAVGRLNNYYDYISRAQQEKISEIRKKINNNNELKNRRQSLIEQLESQQMLQQQQQLALDKKQKLRKQKVASLNSKVSSSASKLDKLKKDRARLNKLLKQIAIGQKKLRKLEEKRRFEEARRLTEQQKQGEKQTHSNPVIRELVKGGFIKQRGRLRYPVSGTKKYAFGSRMAESGMRSDGVFFNTSGSVVVKSIFRGRVLFADFLKGYGLLLIIDHGDNHISLYGHNEVLYKKVDDEVKTNEVVAKSGVTGGLSSAGLYFEIRNGTTPVDPKHWCL